LRQLFSEGALIRERVRIEVRYLDAVLAFLGPDALTAGERGRLFAWADSLGEGDVSEVKSIESQIRHDVKAVEYFVRQHLSDLGLSRCMPWVHWGLTSEDVDNLAYGCMLQQAKDAVWIPAQVQLLEEVLRWAFQYAGTVMLGRTHGQIAVPTTVGKEFAVFASRAVFFLERLIPLRFGGKLSGAVGNLNGQLQVFPDRDWLGFSQGFVAAMGLEPTPLSTQIEPGTRLVHFLDLGRQLHNVWLDLARDCWLYVAFDCFQQRAVPGEVGSSTMPHKVNPIRFENAEGNLQLANSLLSLLADKLPLSRLQRDLSDKTVKRNLGVALGHSLVAAANLQRGLQRLTPDERLLRAQVQAHPEVLAEGLQLLLRARGDEGAFTQVQEAVRGREGGWDDLLLSLDKEVRSTVEEWLPEAYVGLAEQLARQEVERIERVLDIRVEREG
jgi:adenylosuccinate lyase